MTDLKNLTINYDDCIAIVEFNQENAKVNTLSEGMMNEFVPVFDQLQNNDNIKGIVVISAKPGSFIAGADINMLESAQSRDELYKMSRNGQDIMNRIEQSPKPIIAAIAGSCLGGGFEIALACHYRIALNDKQTKFGVPEVKLGLLPGAGGTQRLLQNLLLPDALDLLLTGREIQAKKAKTMGLVDILVQSIGTDLENMEYLYSFAVQKAKQLIVQRPSKRQYGLIESLIQTFKILNGAGLNAEAEAFADLGMTNESKALISLFHGRTECKKNKFGKLNREIKTIAIIGASVIGAGIAHVSIDKGLQVILYDTTEHALSRGQLQITKGYQNYIKRNRITHTEYKQILSNLNYQRTFDNLYKCDIIIESLYEDLKVKQNILDKLEQHISEHCIFASNTYTISIHDIASNSQRPDKIIGMHYFSPVDKVELLEIIRTKQTSDETICSAVHIGLKQGKIIIVVNDGPGFYTTRLLAFISVEIFYLLNEGLSPKDIDKATKSFGFHVGLATLLDEFGIDIIANIVFHLQTIFGERLIDLSIIELFRKFIRNYLFGKKSQQGLYIYSNDNHNKKEINPKIKELIKDTSIQTKEILTMEDIQWRICLRLLNEAAKCLEENIINSPTDGDVGAVFGLGFSPMKGGPFRFMDTYGISKIVDLMNNYQLKHGDRFIPTQLLINMSKENKTFYS
ncbi:unnamed protein product [Adineta steineri]|uniref:enoyl-CoA hydratase n=1 Tax=Adineta steineri TaxID=433720 RepID=A0A814URB5_9BILA|nr:unnamed protein product [Adineta steineri]